MAVSFDIVPTGVHYSRNPIWYRLQCSGFASQSNYYVAVTVEVGSVTSDEIHTYPDANGRIDLDVSDIVEALMESDVAEVVPNPSSATHYKIAGAREVRINIIETFGDPPAAQATATSAQIVVVKGGIDAQDFADGQWWTATPTTQSFMSWWPQNRRVARDMPNWLAWTRKELDRDDDVSIEVEAFDNLGQAVATSYVSPTINASTGEIAVLAVGVAQLELPSTVAYYRVRVIHQEFLPDGNTLSLQDVETDWVEYTIDHLPHRNNRYLIALNVWGAPEVIRCTGNRAKQQTYAPTEVMRSLGLAYDRSSYNYAQTEHNQSADYTFRTGYLHESEVDVIGGLVGIGRMWEVVTAGLRSVLPKGLKRFVTQEDDQEVHVAELKVTRGLIMRNYTPTKDDDANDESPYWLEDDGSPWEEPTANEFWEVP